VSLLRRRKEKLGYQKGEGEILAPQGLERIKNEEVNLLFTFYLVPYALSPPWRFLLC